MKRIIIATAAAAFLVGLPIGTVRAEEEGSDKDAALMCAKCETVWVKVPRQVGKTTVYTSQKKMLCEDCKSAVANFFATGKFEHTCKSCGSLVECEAAQAEAGEGEKPEGSKFVPGTDAAHQHHLNHPESK